LRLANDEQKARWLPKFCTGEIITRDRNDRARYGQRPARASRPEPQKEGDHYILNGAKDLHH